MKFYIEVGDMSPEEAIKVIQEVIDRRRRPDPEPELEEWTCMKGGQGKGSKVETLPGGENLEKSYNPLSLLEDFGGPPPKETPEKKAAEDKKDEPYNPLSLLEDYYFAVDSKAVPVQDIWKAQEKAEAALNRIRSKKE